ncbi:MAG: ATP-NAD kinase family protein [Oscillospiraceae bacterium]|nr:ATP-NAD kinase family protein [Oscillospiraceae bacterium]
MKRVGLIVNPIAGLGGAAALKGSDGEASKEALLRGYSPHAQNRAVIALSELPKDMTVLTFAGDMGENSTRMAGVPYEVIADFGADTDGKNTESAARLLMERKADLILFAGGDGTARDICRAVNDSVTVIGIPAGVKIHSSVYAKTPRYAGMLAAKYLTGTLTTALGEVMDIDEEAFREGRVSSRLYGAMKVPVDKLLQSKKSGGYSNEDNTRAIASAVKEEMIGDTLCIFGPGSTTHLVMKELGLSGTLLGVDAVLNGEVISPDVDEKKLFSLCERAQRTKLFVTPIGGQGMLFGRGNQQLSPRVLRLIGKENIVVIATKEKLASLELRPLVCDSGDEILDKEFSGYIKVRVSKDETVIYKLDI